MPIDMPRGLPFSVDTWNRRSRAKRYHFLTHAHKDHASSISSYASFPIYATQITKLLIVRQFPQVEESLFVEMRIGQSIVVDDPDCRFTVTAFDANHCIGAVMLLFEGDFGNILHTGDCRLTVDCVQSLPLKYVNKEGRRPRIFLDYLFLDCTFASHPLKIPSKNSAIQQVIKCIWEHPHAPVVYLACDLLGQEDILFHVSRVFGSKIYVDKSVSADFYGALEILAPDIISDDLSSRFQVCEGFPGLYERAEAKLSEARAKLQPEPLFIRASTQWYACKNDSANDKKSNRLKRAEKDEHGVWHVCYSMHSSKEELEIALQILRPKRVISTTPNCRALELEYVRNNSNIGHVSSDDPVWKLLDIKTEKLHISHASAPKELVVDANDFKSPTSHPTNDLKSPTSHQTSWEEKLNLCSPPKPTSLTLFGTEWLGFRNSVPLPQPCSPSQSVTDVVERSSKTVESCSTVICSEKADLDEGSCAERQDEDEDNGIDRNSFVVDQSRSLDHGFSNDPRKNASVNSRSLDLNLRKFYRSMNVPVPRPLPSLMELMNVAKRAKMCATKR